MSLAIILVSTQLAENLGAVARAMANFDLKDLRLVNPLCDPKDPKALATAAGADSLLMDAKVYASLENAAADLNYLYGTSVRKRYMMKPYVNIRDGVEMIQKQIKEGAKTAVVFGPERTGLTNDLLSLCRWVMLIPVVGDFSSLNLAQSVAITAYEWFLANNADQIKGITPMQTSQSASQLELSSMLGALEERLNEINFWRTENQKSVMWRNLKNIFTRTSLTSQEVRTLRGVIKNIGQYKGVING